MRIDVPFLPICIEVRGRRLAPIRFTLLRLMIAVAIVGLFFGSRARLGELNRGWAVHQQQALDATKRGDGPEADRHQDRANTYLHAYERLDAVHFGVMVLAGLTATVALFGRILDLLIRRPSPVPELEREGPRP